MWIFSKKNRLITASQLQNASFLNYLSTRKEIRPLDVPVQSGFCFPCGGGRFQNLKKMIHIFDRTPYASFSLWLTSASITLVQAYIKYISQNFLSILCHFCIFQIFGKSAPDPPELKNRQNIIFQKSVKIKFWLPCHQNSDQSKQNLLRYHGGARSIAPRYLIGFFVKKVS